MAKGTAWFLDVDQWFGTTEEHIYCFNLLQYNFNQAFTFVIFVSNAVWSETCLHLQQANLFYNICCLKKAEVLGYEQLSRPFLESSTDETVIL